MHYNHSGHYYSDEWDLGDNRHKKVGKGEGKMEKTSLYNKLIEYGQSDYYPYHMPGHKRSSNVDESLAWSQDPLAYMRSIDITEIDGFDNLHHAEGILKQAQERAATAYGAKRSYYLVGGSTVGILTAISALIPSGGRILIARNCHKSVYHAIFLRGLKVSYIQPEYEAQFGIPLPVTADVVEQALEKEPDIQAVLITSPTYEGLVADVEGIAEAAHKHGVPLIVDEAHGAHFGFADMLPQSSVRYADVVIHSTHKTTLALTQTALLHVCNDRVDCDEIQRYLDIYMTSSPSYVLMASIEEAVREMTEHGQSLYESYVREAVTFCQGVAKLQYFQVLQVPDMIQDPCKLVIGSSIADFSGQQLYDLLLQKYHLQMELCQGRYVLAIMTPYDKPEGFERLLSALKELDENMAQGRLGGISVAYFAGHPAKQLPKQQMLPTEAWRKGSACLLAECEGRICSEFVYQYPPGVPIMVPGEVWSRSMIEHVEKLYEMGYEILGTKKDLGIIYTYVL
ncbi:MAG: aminotransferase class I/II-fold pyridoxal phosphate-dependent enzyme [Lachnospiraceae bacterium]|nr:aminotransferase class I/II-fold pyridoxal phosphate-dependent enzyme [Lachnospiraceae bacterium]